MSTLYLRTWALLVLLQSFGFAAPMRVLFIGNSHTSAHNVPQIVADIAKIAGQRPLEFEMLVRGNYRLEQHWNDGLALEKIRTGTWDYVVLQEQSQWIENLTQSYLDSVLKFEAEIGKTGAKTVLYLVWYLRESNLDESWEVSWLKRSVKLAEQRPILLAPVSQAWLLARVNNLNLYERDGNHANALGAYLSACVLYGVLYGKSAVGLAIPEVSGLDAKLAPRLQALAWDAVQKIR